MNLCACAWRNRLDALGADDVAHLNAEADRAARPRVGQAGEDLAAELAAVLHREQAELRGRLAARRFDLHRSESEDPAEQLLLDLHRLNAVPAHVRMVLEDDAGAFVYAGVDDGERLVAPRNPREQDDDERQGDQTAEDDQHDRDGDVLEAIGEITHAGFEDFDDDVEDNDAEHHPQRSALGERGDLVEFAPGVFRHRRAEAALAGLRGGVRRGMRRGARRGRAIENHRPSMFASPSAVSFSRRRSASSSATPGIFASVRADAVTNSTDARP